MSDDYLFDGSGEVDADVARLEQRLKPLRYQGRPRRSRPLTTLALAATVLIAVGAGAAWALWPSSPAPWTSRTADCQGCVWEEGVRLDTTTDAHALVDDKGQLIATTGTLLTRLPHPDGALLRLERGRIDVQVNAPARWLTVEVPGVDVVDLGCAYSLVVDEGGRANVAVRSGAVALEGTTRTEVLAGAIAATWPDGRTGLPVRLDATPELIASVNLWDQGRSAAKDDLLAAAQPRDAVTLWHLLQRQTEPQSRAQVLDRIEDLVRLPEAPSRPPLLAGEPEAMEVLLAALIGATW